MRASTISVIIPIYNRAHLLGRAVTSVLEQTREDWELIVVDDHSSDDPATVLEAFGDSRFRYIRHSKNRGAPAARNSGMLAACGSYIAFLDSDDEWYPEKLASQLGAFERAEPQLGAVVSGAEIITNAGKRVGTPVFDPEPIRRLLDFDSGVVVTSALTIRRSVVEQGVRFDQRMPAYQELDFLIQIIQAGFDITASLVVPVRLRYDDEGQHISHPAAHLEALLTFEQKYRTEMSRYGRGRLYLKLMRTHAALGNIGSARRASRRAGWAQPLATKRWPLIASSYFGDSIFLSTLGLYTKLAPQRW